MDTRAHARLLIDTLRLGEPNDRTALAARWARADALALVQLAIFEGAELWLARRLSALGIALTGPARERLATETKRGLAQSLRVDAETVTALGILDSVGILAVPLKAAALRKVAGRIPYADARAPNDVDLLVPLDASHEAWNALLANGYRIPKLVGPDDGHHLFGVAGPIGVAVELHTTTVSDVPPSEAWRRALYDDAVGVFGDRLRPIPGDTELLWHAVTHQMGHAAELASTMRLRYWLEAAVLLAADLEIDWERLRSRFDAPEARDGRLARAWLRSVTLFSGRPIPAGALGQDGPAFDVERMLAWRLDILTRHGLSSRWAEKLIEEGARAEAGFPPQSARADASPWARFRHGAAARAARVIWSVRA